MGAQGGPGERAQDVARLLPRRSRGTRDNACLTPQHLISAQKKRRQARRAARFHPREQFPSTAGPAHVRCGRRMWLASQGQALPEVSLTIAAVGCRTGGRFWLRPPERGVDERAATGKAGYRFAAGEYWCPPAQCTAPAWGALADKD